MARSPGNSLDYLFVSLATDERSLVRRLRRVSADARFALCARSAFGTHLFGLRAELVPLLFLRAFHFWSRTGLANHLRPPANVIASTVAGPVHQVALAGAELTKIFSVGPLIEGMGLNVTAWSYGESLFVTVVGTPETLEEPRDLASRIGDSLTNLLDAVRLSDETGDNR